MRSKKSAIEDIDNKAYHAFWNIFDHNRLAGIVFSGNDMEDIPGELGENSTLVYLYDLPIDMWLQRFFENAETVVKVRYMFSELVATLGEEKLGETILKSLKAVDKLVLDTAPIDEMIAEAAFNKADESIANTSLRMYDMFSAALGTPMEDQVKRDLASMLPGLVFEIMWRRTMWETGANDGAMRLMEYKDGYTLKGAAELLSKKIIDYAHKFGRMYREGTADSG